MKKLIAFAVAVILSGIFTVQAAEPKTDPNMAVRNKLALELLQTMKVDQLLEQSLDNVKNMQAQIMKQTIQNAKDQTSALKIQNKVMDLMKKEWSWENLKPEFVKLYADTFSEDELKGLINFYKSPVGQAFIKKQPEMQQKSMIMVQQLIMRVMPKLKALTLQLQQEETAPAKAVPAKTN